MISAGLPGGTEGLLGQLGLYPPPPAMTPEFLPPPPRPYARYPPRAPRPAAVPQREPQPQPPSATPAFPPVPGAYTRFLPHPTPYPYMYRTQAPVPQPPTATFGSRARAGSGFVPPAPRSPPSAPAATPPTPPPARSPERAAPAPHFCRGALIRLENGSLRRVEDMRTEDFMASAERCSDLSLTHCTLLRLDERPTGTLSITLAYDENRSRVEMESTVEHPFFVYGQGWASCAPERTLRMYGLRVRRLQVGDVCVSLMARARRPPQVAPPTLQPPPQSFPENLSIKEDARKRRWSAPEVCDDDPRPPAKKR